MKFLKDGLYQVTQPHFCAGFIVKGNVAIMIAPILRKREDYWRIKAVRISD